MKSDLVVDFLFLINDEVILMIEVESEPYPGFVLSWATMLDDEGCIDVAIVVEVHSENVACGDDEDVTVWGVSEYLAFYNTIL